MDDMTDPRDLGGDIAGPGGPHDFGGVVLDASKALIVDYQEVCKIDEGARGRLGFAVLVSGRINQSEDRAKVMLFESLDGLAALVTEIHAVAERAGVGVELYKLCGERWQKLKKDGNATD
jgi:hypothetical protein